MANARSPAIYKMAIRLGASLRYRLGLKATGIVPVACLEFRTAGRIEN
jgi:hypothetical protein